jgi:hypothetical protein
MSDRHKVNILVSQDISEASKGPTVFICIDA